MKRQIRTAIGLTVVICAGFWFYTQWDLKKFKESLPKGPHVQSTKSKTAPAHHEVLPQEVTETSGLEPSEFIAAEESFDSTDAEVAPIDVEVAPIDDLAHESVFDTFREETETDEITSGDFTDVSHEDPYDIALVRKGFDDYNAYLQLNPEYAYLRLGEALREQYNNDPDVDIIVETVRQSNEGAITIDTAIYYAETMIKLESDGISPPEAVAALVGHLEYLREVKQLALESGEDTVHLFNFRAHIGE